MKYTSLVKAITATLLISGCASKNKTASQEAKDNWTNARAGVSEGIARDQFFSGNLKQARQSIDQALATSNARSSAFILSAQIAIEEGKLETAQASLKQAAELDQTNPEIDYLLGVVNQRWQRPELALANYRAASTKKPSDLAFTMAEAETLVEMERVDEAIALLEKRVVFFESSSPIRDVLAQLLERRNKGNDLTRAIDLYRQATVLESGDDAVRERLAIAFYRGKRFGEAAVVLQRLIVKPEFAKRGDLHLAIGNCEMEQGNFGEARPSFERASALGAKQSSPHIGIAKASMALGDFKRAQVALSRAATLSAATPVESMEVSLLQTTLAIKQAKWAEAKIAAERVLVMQPENGTALVMLGLAESRLGRAKEAKAALAMALSVDPNDALARSILQNVVR